MSNWIKTIGSYLGGNLVEQIKSPLNGELYVYHIKGNYLLNSKSTNYSYGELHKGFQKALKHINIAEKKIESCLILGFGTGSVVSILREEHDLDFPIIALEKDPIVIKLGKKYFNIDRFEKLEIIAADASKYILSQNQVFDFIVFDIYIDNFIPSFFESDEFLKSLKKRLSPNGSLLFNKDINNPEMKESLTNLEKNLAANFSSVQKFQVVKNNFFFLVKH